jgi:hypothetical protein
MGEKKKQGKAARMIWGIGAGVIMGLVLASNDFKLGEPIWIVLPAIILAVYLQVIIHELGHMVMGSLGGYRLYSFRVLGFILQKENERFKLSYQKAVGYGGLCMMFPPAGASRGQNLLFFAGGILFNFLSFAVFAMILSYAAPEEGFGRIFLYASLWVSLFMGLMNAIPFKNRRNYESDGKHIRNAIQGNETYRDMMSLYNLSVRSSAGVRPAFLDDPCLQNPEQINHPGRRNAALQMAYYHHLDLGRKAKALACLQRLEEGLAYSTPTAQESIKTDMLFAACTYTPDKAKADTLYAELGKRLKQYQSVTSYRV